MVRRVVTTVCPEGWYYLFVVAFILGGATLRGVNLLIVLGGMLIGPFLFNWRITKLMLRLVRIERPLPARVCAGQVLHVPATVHNDRTWLSSWTVVVQDRIERIDQVDREGSTQVRVMAPRIAPRHHWVGGYEALLAHRGRYRFGPLKVSTRFPLGLAKSSFAVQQEATLLVCPRLGTLTPRWQQVAGRSQHGDRRAARQHGFLEGDYYGLREWRPGDSKHWIHWRTSARLGKLAVRQFERQRQRDLAVVLDLVQNAHGDQLAEGGETAISFLATVVADLARYGENHLVVGVSAAEQRLWAGPTSTVLTYEVWDHLALVRPGSGATLGDTLDKVQQEARAEMPLVVISNRSRPPSGELSAAAGMRDLGRSRSRNGLRFTWINCSQNEQQTYFSLKTRQDAVPV